MHKNKGSFYNNVLLVILITSFNITIYAQPTTHPLPAPLFKNLGKFTYPITTKNKLAQRYFDQGMILFYGFEWGESIRSFSASTQLDPNCAMCYWGLALALTYKGNAPMTGHEQEDARLAIQKALALASTVTPKEQAFIKALAKRYAYTETNSSTKQQAHTIGCRAHSNTNASTKKATTELIAALAELTKTFPEDLEAKNIYAAAIFWNNLDQIKMNNSKATDAIRELKAVLAKDQLNLGANHYFIHFMESLLPAEALDNADRLRTLVPGSEHLVHMPTHIYFLTGRYHEATLSNLQAIATYKDYSRACQKQGFQPEITYLYHHDFDFLRTTAAMEGRKQLALSAARDLLDNLPAEWIEKDPSLQWFIPIPYYVKARFGMWNELLQEPKPLSKYQYALGMWHYAQGMAFAHINNLANAEKELSALSSIIKQNEKASNLTQAELDLLTIADEILNATLADAKEDETAVFLHLKKAESIQDSMGYHEPPDWYFPVRQALADAYLKWGHPKEALQTYQKDLKQYPKNGWSLYGVTKSLRQLNDNQNAKQSEAQFNQAWKYADIPAPVSLFPSKDTEVRKSNE